jgi:RHS repeat-associated protein
MTLIKSGSTTETPKRCFAKMLNAIVLLLTLAILIPFPAPVLAVQPANCELPDGDVDGDECITQNTAKNNGGDNPDCNNCPTVAGNPINIATGNKFENEVDYLSGGPSPLLLRRSYNSLDSNTSSFGVGWRGAYSRAVSPPYYGWFIRNGYYNYGYAVDVTRDDGKVLTFYLNGSQWQSDSDVNSRLVKLANGWQYTTGLDEIEIYDANGKLLSVTDRARMTQRLSYDGQGHLVSVTNPFGRSLTFAYAGARVASVTVPNGGVYSYSYDAKNNLSTVTYPDKTRRTYVYENLAYPHALTGIVDENGKRFATYAYDALGRAISTEHSGGVNKYTLDYNYLTYGYVPVKDALNVTRTSTFTSINQVALETLMTQSCPSCPGNYATTKTTTTYDANGNITSQTDFNGNVTTYTYDLTRNLQLSRTEAAGTPQARTVTTTWHPTFRLPVEIVEPNRSTRFSYDAQGNLLQKTVTADAQTQTQTWTLTYNANGQPLTLDGPRTDVSDVTRFTYDGQGNLATVTDALGHVTTLTAYNADGQPLVLKNPNGLVTTFEYDALGRPVALTVGAEVTRYRYDAAGQLIGITLSNAATIAYRYDDAHRLVSIADALGNHIDYTLDKMGNRLNTQVSDPANTLTRTSAQVFDGLSRLAKTLGAQNQTASFGYDANGNTTGVKDPLNNKTTLAYDPLNRLIKSIDPTGKSTKASYDSQDNPLAITDPLAHQTNYSYDGFGNRLAIDSPDTGLSEIGYDAAGNPQSRVDARGQSVQYHYDALNRVTQMTYGNQTPVTFTYDQGRSGIGHLTQMTDETGTTRWTYNGQGRVSSKSFSTGSLTLVTRYGYSNNGQLSTLTYPSGQVVHLAYDSNGRISAMDANGSPLLSGIRYEPFGPVRDWAFGNGVSTRRDFDLDGHLIAYDLGDRSRQLTYDAAGRITDYLDSDLNYDQSFAYDALGRLTNASDPVTQTGYSYDANGNRTEQLSGALSKYLSIDASSNRLLAITDGNRQTLKNYTYDAAGHITGDGYHQFRYDGRGRLVQASSVSQVEQYRINGLGQRVAKLHSRAPERSQDADGKSGDHSHAPEAGQAGQDHDKETPAGTYFVYDGAGHLLGEYTEHGKALQETVWLGELPVAVLAGDQHYFVYADHLNSPRAITNHLGRVVWRWDSDPFGVTAEHEGHDRSAAGHHVDEDPDRDGQKFVYNLRFPGQYYDKGTGLHYNTFRNYDPSTGRYIESDPIGLAGGINTYAYVRSNPLRYTDRYGLTPEGAAIGAAVGSTVGAVVGGIVGGAGGTAVAPGVGTIGVGIAGAGEGAVDGAVIGSVLGDAISNILNKSSTDSEPPAREVDLPVPGKTDADSVGAPISIEDAIDIIKNGGDVIAKDKSTAKEIATKAGGNCPPVHDLGHRGGKNHYHPNGRPGGHVFY